MDISTQTESSATTPRRGRPTKREAFPIRRHGREHLSAIREPNPQTGAMPPEALTAVRKAMQWLVCASDARADDDRLGCLNEAEVALQGAGLDFRAVLGSVDQ